MDRCCSLLSTAGPFFCQKLSESLATQITTSEQKKFHEHLLLLAARNEARAQCNRLKDYLR